MKPKISIITVAYNAEKYIEDTIKSVIQQDYEQIEYIIIDGNSKDGTSAICEKYKKHIDIFVSEPDKGIYDAMNKGIKAANGEIIGILNADDFYNHAKVILNIVRQFTESEAECVYANLVYVDQENTDKVTRTWVAKTYQSNAFLKGWMPPHPTFFIKKKWYDKYGYYSLDLKSAADYELMLRMIHRHKIQPTYLNEIIIKMRVGGVSNASFANRLKANKEDRKAWEMNGLKPSTLTLVRKPLSKLNQFFKK